MANVAEDVELAEVLGILLLLVVIGYALWKGGTSLSDWISSLLDRFKNFFSNLGDGGSDFWHSGSGNQSNDNSVAPTTDSIGPCTSDICTGIEG